MINNNFWMSCVVTVEYASFYFVRRSMSSRILKHLLGDKYIVIYVSSRQMSEWILSLQLTFVNSYWFCKTHHIVPQGSTSDSVGLFCKMETIRSPITVVNLTIFLEKKFRHTWKDKLSFTGNCVRRKINHLENNFKKNYRNIQN